MEKPEIKIFIVEDHTMFREGIKFALQTISNFKIVGEADNGTDFLNSIVKQTPDVVLMDIDMPGMNGIEATRIAMQKYPAIKILSLSMHGDYGHYQKMIEAGAKGFVLKNAGITQLTNAIEDVHNGRVYFSQELLMAVIQEKDKQNESDDFIVRLDISERELDVLRLICKGYSNKEIADQLFISVKTVEGHKSKLMLKTDTKNTVSLVLFAIRNSFCKSN